MTSIQEAPEEMTTEIMKEQEIEIMDEETLDHNMTLATLEMDNIYPLDGYGSMQKLAYHRHSPSRNQLTRRKRLLMRCSLLRLWTTRMYLTSKQQNASQNHDLGIIPVRATAELNLIRF